MTNPKQLFVAQVLINKVKIKVLRNLGITKALLEVAHDDEPVCWRIT